jgi:hypothetical protein
MASPERGSEENRDPFENLRLDEGFVRAARFIEPSADERGRAADRRDPGRCQVMPANRRGPAGMYRMVWPPRPGRRRHRVARAIAVIAVLAGLISVFIALRHGVTRSGSSSTASGSHGAQTNPAVSSPLPPATSGVAVTAALFTSLQVGDCVTWDHSASGTGDLAARVVPCAGPHLTEVVSFVDLSWRLPQSSWPGVASFDAVAATECASAFASFTSAARPGVILVASALEPDRDAWSNGVHRLACTAQLEGQATITGRLGPVPSTTRA